eukprot:11205628-Alexandrium_andersonii.AAC.1
MSASLVGSEMCIRDSLWRGCLHWRAGFRSPGPTPTGASGAGGFAGGGLPPRPLDFWIWRLLP